MKDIGIIFLEKQPWLIYNQVNWRILAEKIVFEIVFLQFGIILTQAFVTGLHHKYDFTQDIWVDFTQKSKEIQNLNANRLDYPFLKCYDL